MFSIGLVLGPVARIRPAARHASACCSAGEEGLDGDASCCLRWRPTRLEHVLQLRGTGKPPPGGVHVGAARQAAVRARLARIVRSRARAPPRAAHAAAGCGAAPPAPPSPRSLRCRYDGALATVASSSSAAPQAASSAEKKPPHPADCTT